MAVTTRPRTPSHLPSKHRDEVLRLVRAPGERTDRAPNAEATETTARGSA